jgi:hypothetical protein
MPHVVKWINIKRARRPDLWPLRQVSVEDVKTVSMKGNFINKKIVLI